MIHNWKKRLYISVCFKAGLWMWIKKIKHECHIRKYNIHMVSTKKRLGEHIQVHWGALEFNVKLGRLLDFKATSEWLVEF